MKLVVYRDEANEFRWRLKAANGEIVADSGEGYVHRADCVAMAKEVVGEDVEVVDE